MSKGFFPPSQIAEQGAAQADETLDQMREGLGAAFSAERPNKLEALGKTAKMAAGAIGPGQCRAKGRSLNAAAAALRAASQDICAANALDMTAGQEKGLSKAMLDRLFLDTGQVEAMAKAVEEIAAMENPVGRVLGQSERPNGLNIAKVSVPLGVIGIIYVNRGPTSHLTQRPYVSRQAMPAFLRGGSDSWNSAAIILQAMRQGLDVRASTRLCSAVPKCRACLGGRFVAFVRLCRCDCAQGANR